VRDCITKNQKAPNIHLQWCNYLGKHFKWYKAPIYESYYHNISHNQLLPDPCPLTHPLWSLYQLSKRYAASVLWTASVHDVWIIIILGFQSSGGPRPWVVTAISIGKASYMKYASNMEYRHILETKWQHCNELPRRRLRWTTLKSSSSSSGNFVLYWWWPTEFFFFTQLESWSCCGYRFTKWHVCEIFK
jgi:hypothetical protein